MKTTVYIITHKKVELNIENGYKILLVGADKNNNFKNNYLLDNEGENISFKNNSYCELTGLYWMWKNSDSDIIGLVHYRRFFVKFKPHFDFIGRHVFVSKKNAYRLINAEEINEILQKYDVILRKSETRIQNNRSVFKGLGEEINQVLDELFSKEYREYFNSYQKVLKGHYHFNGNMFIAKKECIDKYCSWLFPLLEKLDLNHKTKTGNFYSNREIGYVPELLFRVWIEHNEIKYKTVPVACIDDTDVPGSLMNLREFIRFVISRFNRKNI